MSPSPYFTIPFLLVMAIFQSVAAPRLTVYGVRPDLMLVSVTAWSLLAAFRARDLQYAGEGPNLLRGINDGVVWGFVGGMFMDLLSGAPFGASALALMAAALVVGMFSVSVAAPAPVLMMVVTPLGTLAYHIVFLGITILAGRPAAWNAEMTRVILPSAVFNLVLIPVVYLLLSPLNRQTERERIEF